MKKLKELLKTKKGILGLSILLILIIAVLLIVFIPNKDAKVSKKLQENTYTIYVKINPLVKIELKENYYICVENSTETVCSDKTNEVVDYTLVNDDAKEIYGDIKLEGLSLIDALVSIYDTARDKDIDFDVVEIYADYEIDSEEIKAEILDQSKYKVSFNIVTTFDKELNEDEIINNSDKNTYYTVTFDSNGGSSVQSIKVKEGYGFTEPTAPTKSGYKFIEWQQNNKKYDFNTEVTGDITLKAKWQKIETENQKTETSDKETTTNNNKENTSTNNKKEENSTTDKTTESDKTTGAETTSNKINLNDNIKVVEYTAEYSNKDCWFFMFVTNLKEIFPNAEIKGSGPYSVSYWAGPDATETEISGVALTNNFKSLKFDTSSETKFLNLLKKYKNGYKGVAEVEYTNDNHKINYRYKYIEFVDNSYEQVGKKADEAVTNALKNATRFYGTCGFAEEYKEVNLTEELCNKYNLDCDRW